MMKLLGKGKGFYRKRKGAIVFVVCILLFGCCLTALSIVFVPKSDPYTPWPSETWDGFYAEPENTLDVLYIGSSRVLTAFTPTEIYEKYGFTGYVLASSRMRYNGVKLYLEEALTRQTPKVVVIENKLYDGWDYPFFEPEYRRIVDYLQVSTRKVNMARSITDGDSAQSFWSYMVPFLRYHDRWEELTAKDIYFNFEQNHGAYKGWLNYARHKEYDYGTLTDEVRTDYNAEAVECFWQIKDICDQNGIELVMVDMPSAQGALHPDRINGGQAFCEENGIRYANLNTPEFWEASGIDPKTDFWSASHLNDLGSLKVSDYVGRYLSELGLLTDRRGDGSAVSSAWEHDVLLTRHRWLKNFAAGYADIYHAVIGERNGAQVTLSWSALQFYNGVTIRRLDETTNQWVTLCEGAAGSSYIDTNAPEAAQYQLDFTVETLEEQPVTLSITVK